jgi:hypothetical protein
MHTITKGPFPFKGKGENDWCLKTLRERVERLQTERQRIVRMMHVLIDDYERTFAGNLSAYLVFHKTANGNYVRWRMSGVKQRYFAIADDAIGKEFLASQSPTVRKVLLDFEKQRLRLNLLHGLHFYESKSLERLILHSREVNRLARDSL